MIKLNTVYKAGKQEVKFQEKEPGIIVAEYGDESIEGKVKVDVRFENETFWLTQKQWGRFLIAPQIMFLYI